LLHAGTLRYIRIGSDRATAPTPVPAPSFAADHHAGTAMCERMRERIAQSDRSNRLVGFSDEVIGSPLRALPSASNYQVCQRRRRDFIYDSIHEIRNTGTAGCGGLLEHGDSFRVRWKERTGPAAGRGLRTAQAFTWRVRSLPQGAVQPNVWADCYLGRKNEKKKREEKPSTRRAGRYRIDKGDNAPSLLRARRLQGPDMAVVTENYRFTVPRSMGKFRKYFRRLPWVCGDLTLTRTIFPPWRCTDMGRRDCRID